VKAGLTGLATAPAAVAAKYMMTNSMELRQYIVNLLSFVTRPSRVRELDTLTTIVSNSA